MKKNIKLNKMLELLEYEAAKIDQAFEEAIMHQDNSETKGLKREEAFKSSFKKFLSRNFDLAKGTIYSC